MLPQLALTLNYLFYLFILLSGSSATNLQLQLPVRDNCRIEKPEFLGRSSLSVACSSNRKLMMRSLSSHERGRLPGLLNPCPKIGNRGGERLILETGSGCTIEPVSFHVTSDGFSQEKQRQIPSFEPAGAAGTVPSIQVLQYKRSHSMPPVLNDTVIGIEAFMTQASLEQISTGPATRSHLGVVPDAVQATAVSGHHHGESSQLYNNDDLTSSDVAVSLQVHDQISAEDSSIVLNITPPHEGGRTSHAFGSREVELEPNPRPSDLESGRASFPLRREDEPLVHNPSRLTETSLGISAQAALAILTIRSSGNSSLSDDAKILLRSAVALDIIGFLCCVIGILVGGKKYGGLITAVGYIATVYGFVAIMGMQLDDHLKLWIIAAAWIALFPILLVFALCRKIESTPAT